LEKPGIQSSLCPEYQSGDGGTEDKEDRKNKKDLLGAPRSCFSSANPDVQKMLLSSLPGRRCSSVLLARFFVDCHCQFSTLLPSNRCCFATNSSIGVQQK
jgi:hypothetical protein